MSGRVVFKILLYSCSNKKPQINHIEILAINYFKIHVILCQNVFNLIAVFDTK